MMMAAIARTGRAFFFSCHLPCHVPSLSPDASIYQHSTRVILLRKEAMARDEEHGLMLAPHIAVQVTRKGLERITSAAVLAPYVKREDGREEGEDRGGGGGDETGFENKAGPRWSLAVYEVPDNDQLSSLDSILVQTGPALAYFPTEPPSKKEEAGGGGGGGGGKGGAKADLHKLQHILERQGIDSSPVCSKGGSFRPPPEDFETSLLPRLLAPGRADLLQYKNELDYTRAMACAHVLLKTMDMMDEEGSIHLSLGSLQQYVRLDSSAAEAINLFPPERGERPWMENGSLYQILNKCKTKMGERLLQRWLRQPLVDPAKINARLDIVQQLTEDVHLRCSLQDDALRGTPDLETLALKLQRKKAGLIDIYKIYTFAQRLPLYAGALEEASRGETDGAPPSPLQQRFSKDIFRLQEHFRKFSSLVECVIDMSALPDLTINPAHDPALAELKEELDEVESEIETLFNKASRGFAQDLGIELRLELQKTTGTYCFRTTKPADDKKLRACKTVRCDILSILKNGVHFTTPPLKEASGRFVELKAEYSQKQSGLVKKAVETACTYLPLIEAAARLVAELDVLVSLGHVAALAPSGYRRPSIYEKGGGTGIIIKGGRHPCLEMQENVNFIPNDYILTRGESSFTLVTGPNMGGKSTYIRGLGCLCVMAQIGSFVPADVMELPVVDAVLARVGAGDAAQRGVSTFMAEMLEASTILQTATPHSLLIIDELGRGTSTFDGFGLAWAISEYIVRRLGAPCLFATHFHELTALEHKAPGVRNLHVSATTAPGSITMLYEVRPGPCLDSYGIHVARMAHFPASVIEEATAKAKELEFLEGKNQFAPSSSSPAHKKARSSLSSAASLSAPARAVLVACEGKEQPQQALKALGRDFADLPLDTLTEASVVVSKLEEIVDGMKGKVPQ